MNATTTDIYTVAQIADMFDVHVHTVYRWIHCGILSASRVGHRFYITRRSLEEALLSQTSKEIHNDDTHSHS